MSVSVYPRHGGLLSNHPGKTFRAGHQQDPEHDAVVLRRVLGYEKCLRPAGEGVEPKLRHHVPAAHLRSRDRRFPPDPRRRDLIPLLPDVRAGAAVRRGAVLRLVGPVLQPHETAARGRAGCHGKLLTDVQHHDDPRRENARDGEKTFYAGGLFCGARPYGGDGNDRRQGLRNASCPRDHPKP